MAAPEPTPQPQPEPAPQPTPAPAPTPSLTTEALPEDLRDHSALAPYISPEGTLDLPALAKSHVSAQQLIGGDRVPIPKPDAPQEQWDQLFSRLGRPETPEKYELKPPEDGPEIRDDLLSGYREKAHGLGLSQSQAEGLLSWFAETEGAEIERLTGLGTEAQQAAEAELRKEYGQAFEEKVERAMGLIEEYGGKDLKSYLETSGLGNHPALVRFAVKVAETLSEDTVAPGVKGASRFGLTPKAAQSEISSLMADPAYLNELDPRHGEVVKKLEELARAAYPEPSE